MRFINGTLAAAVPAISAAILLFPASAFAQETPPFARTEQRVGCASYDPLRQPFFGETHLHTSYSFDAYTTSMRNDPNAAYAFAKGAPVKLPAASAQAGKPQTRKAQLPRPIDFAAVTDHSELLGPMEICTRSKKGTAGYKSLSCRQMRTGRVNPKNPDTFNPTAVAGLWAALPLLQPKTSDPLPLCDRSKVDCDAATVSIWKAIQRAAENAYDRTSDCSFTSFIGYEYTAQPRTANLHRNVIFRNADVPKMPISAVDTGGPYPTVLWQKLRQQCLEANGNCDVLTIPHNANLAGGIMFPDPANVAEAKERAFFEPLTEIYQHKGASECRYDRLAHKGVETTDPLCTFEQLTNDVLGPQANPPDIENFPPRNMIRNVLKDGMVLAQHLNGINPFKYGFIGGTDSHNGDPGNTVEQTFQGHAGTLDAPLAAMINNIRLSPGSLAVVWAEENSRDSIFAAMRRKETYATSGTRPIVRFFGGWGFDDKHLKNLCDQPDRVQIGYDQGVPMGSDLPPKSGATPSFLVAALRDKESAKLQRIQIVKGWVDSAGQTHERVYDVAGSQGPSNPAYDRWVCSQEKYDAALTGNALVKEIRTESSQISRANAFPGAHGYNELCTVWADPHFNRSQPAFYYARVLEMPTCRWSTLACQAAHVDPFASPQVCKIQAFLANFTAAAKGDIAVGEQPFNNCCLTELNDPFMERTIQERAWTSPVWYVPGG